MDSNISARAALGISEFCAAHSISRSSYYNLVREGRAPRTFRVGTKVLISVEAAAEWRRSMESGL